MLDNAESSSPMLLLTSGKAYNISDNQVQNSIHEIVRQKIRCLPTDEIGNHRVYYLNGGAGEKPNVYSKSSLEPESSNTSPTSPEPTSVYGHCGQSDISHNSKATTCSSITPLTSPVCHDSSSSSVSDHSHSIARNVVLSPIMTRPRKPHIRIPITTPTAMSDDVSDYAVLRQLPLVKLPIDHETSSRTSDCSSGQDSGFGSNCHRSVLKQISFASPSLTRDLCNPYGYVKPKMTTFALPPCQEVRSSVNPLSSSGGAPSILRSPFHSLPSGKN